jgi:hypothetical protein
MHTKKQSPRTIAGRDEIVYEHQNSDRLADMFTAADRTGNYGFAAEILDTLLRRHRVDKYDAPPLIHNVPTEGIKGRIIEALWHQKRWGRGGDKG